MFSDNMWTGIVSIALALIGLATFAVLVSNKASSAKVITAGSNALFNNILAAESPVTGSSLTPVSSSMLN